MDERHGLPPRIMSRMDRVKALRHGLAKRKGRLVKSMAHIPNPRMSDLARWDEMRREIAEFEDVLARVLAGEAVAPSPLTGARAGCLPDRIDADRIGPTRGEA